MKAAIAVGLLFLPISSVWALSGEGPVTDFLETTFEDPILQQTRVADLGFCSEWNPDFTYNGRRCCAIFRPGRRNRNLNKCPPSRYKTSYCNEMTPEQRLYAEKGQAGTLPDVLKLVEQSQKRTGEQAFCTVNNGFLVHGRKLIPSPINRIEIRSPTRCLDFGTDALTGLLEWLGRQVAAQYSAPEYARVKLLVGDMAAPRGGCLWGRSGRRGHASHTSGQDADVGFLTVTKGRESPKQFHKQFDVQSNGWLLRRIFENPYACVKVVFLDRRHISKLDRALRNDPEWQQLKRFVRHVPGHRNHFHIRVGHAPGQPGCQPDSHPELEDEEITQEPEGDTEGDDS